MDCEQGTTSEVLEGYVAGTLDAASADRLELHLLECPHCVSAIEALEIAREDLASRAHEIRTRSTNSRLFDFRFWVPALAAALILLVVGGRLLSRRDRPSTVARVSPAPEVPKSPEPVVKPETQQPTAPAQPESANGTNAVPNPTKSKPETVSPKGEQSVAPTHPPTEVAQQPPSTPAQQEISKSAEPKVSTKANRLTDEQALELFRLSDVRVAPAYTAAGSAAGTKPGKATQQAGVSESGQIAGNTLFQQGMISYVEKDYVRAAELLDLAANTGKHPPEVDFYLGVCRLINGHPKDAKEPLQRVIADGKSSQVPAAHLYLAKAYMQEGILAEAESELQLAAIRPGTVKAEATALLARLRALRKSMSDSGTAPLP